MSVSLPSFYNLLNKVEPPQRAVLYGLSRVIRVIATDETLRTFRVEQLTITGRDALAPQGSWHTLSTHSSQAEGQSYSIAVKAALAAQKKLRRKLQQRGQRPQLVSA